MTFVYRDVKVLVQAVSLETTKHTLMKIEDKVAY